MAGRARHEQKNDALGLGWKMGLLRRKGIREGSRCCPTTLSEQTAERNRAEPDAALLKEPAASDQPGIEAAIKM